MAMANVPLASRHPVRIKFNDGEFECLKSLTRLTTDKSVIKDAPLVFVLQLLLLVVFNRANIIHADRFQSLR